MATAAHCWIQASSRTRRRRRRRPRHHATAPTAALQEDAVPREPFYSRTLRSLCERMLVMGLVRDRSQLFRTHRSVMIGREIVDFMVSTRQCATRVQAIQLGEELLRRGLIQLAANQKQEFRDDGSFYSFEADAIAPRLSPLFVSPDSARPGTLSLPRAARVARASVYGGDTVKGPRSSIVSGTASGDTSVPAAPFLGGITEEESSAESGEDDSADVSRPTSPSAAPPSPRAGEPADDKRSSVAAASVSPTAAPAQPAPARATWHARASGSEKSLSRQARDLHRRWDSLHEQETQLVSDERVLRERLVRQGFLRKQGHRFRTWRRRWFALEGHHVRYFKDPVAMHPRGEVDLLDYAVVESTVPDPGKSIRLSHKRCADTSLDYLIAADTPEDCQEWLEAFRKVLREFEDLQSRRDLLDEEFQEIQRLAAEEQAAVEHGRQTVSRRARRTMR